MLDEGDIHRVDRGDLGAAQGAEEADREDRPVPLRFQGRAKA